MPTADRRESTNDSAPMGDIDRPGLQRPLVTAWPQRAALRAGSEARAARSIRPAQRIVDAGCHLSLTKGGNFTITELAKESGVSLQTFYRYFAGRDEVVLAVIEQRIAEACVFLRVEALQQPDALSRLRWYVDATLGLLQDRSRPAARRFFAAERYRLQEFFPNEIESAVDSFVWLLVPEIEAATAAGLLRPRDVERDARFVTQMVLSTFHSYAFATEPPPIDLNNQVWEFCFAALGGLDGTESAATANQVAPGWAARTRLRRPRRTGN